MPVKYLERSVGPSICSPAMTNDRVLKAPAWHLRHPHAHLLPAQYPKAPTAKIDAPDAPVSEYLKVRERLGIERTVVVQPSTYGTDNRCTLEAVKALRIECARRGRRRSNSDRC